MSKIIDMPRLGDRQKRTIAPARIIQSSRKVQEFSENEVYLEWPLFEVYSEYTELDLQTLSTKLNMVDR
ncbi:hypothetical protein T07_14202 [Trichinella nelsoni]|uniref:Uncharacterized protein n=1 Tax=Trichinella nelsoni TaxID=6336 RepID=A0A0V0RE50_9BILA|nr:hypothetical protein T07_14202 [Trichinella nelsoni]